MSSAQNERHPRIRPALPVRALLDGQLVLTKAADLSLTGCFLEGLPKPRSDSLALELPIGERWIRLRARIVRVQKGAEVGCDLAVTFQDLPWDDICAIARFLANKME